MTRYFATVRLETASVPFQRSIVSGVHFLQPQFAEVAQHALGRVSVVGDRRRLAGPIVLDVAQLLSRRVGDSGAGAHHPRELGSTHLGEHIIEPGFRQTLRHIAGRRATAARPRRTALLLDLAPVRLPVLRVPRRPRWRSTQKTCPLGGRDGAATCRAVPDPRDIFSKPSRAGPKRERLKIPHLQPRRGEGIEPSKRRVPTPCRF